MICENLSPAAAAPVSLPRNPIEGPPVFSAVTAGAATPTVHFKTMAYLLGGLGLALGGTAVGISLWNRGQNANVNTEYDNRGAPTSLGYYDRAIKYNEDAEAVRRNSLLAVGFAVASVGLLAGGVYLFLHDRKRDEKQGAAGGPRSWAALTPGGLSLTGVW